MNASKIPSRLSARLPIAMLLLCGFARADTIIPTGVDWSRGESILIKEDGVDTQAYFAGVIYIAVDSRGQQYNRDSLCVDLFTDIYLGVEYDTEIVHPTGVSGKNLPRVSWLVDNALLPTQVPVGKTFQSALPDSNWVTSSAQGAGIQLAIWDIVHDQGDGFSSGRVQAAGTAANPTTDAAVLQWAKFYEAASKGQSSSLAFVYKNVNMQNGQPAQMLAGPEFLDGGPVSNPEPATMVMMGTALVGAGALFRRRGRGLPKYAER